MPISETVEVLAGAFGDHCWSGVSAVPAAAPGPGGASMLSLLDWLCGGIWGDSDPGCPVSRLVCPRVP